ncbi:MAG: hypothetical protein AB1634_03305 [Thermodesulfobacteriota bacterium]
MAQAKTAAIARMLTPAERLAQLASAREGQVNPAASADPLVDVASDLKLGGEAFTAAGTGTAGVLRHVDHFAAIFRDAADGIDSLRDVLAGWEESALLSRLERYIETYFGQAAGRLFPERPAERARYFAGASRENGLPGFPGQDLDDLRHAVDRAEGPEPPQRGLFRTGQILLADTQQVERLRHGLARLAQDRSRQLVQARAQLAALEEEIDGSRQELARRNDVRAQALDDYAVARRLLAEHWQELLAAIDRRRAILEAHQGLYYTRVRETAVERSLPDPLELRLAGADDVVPGCPAGSVDLPDELAPFVEAVLEIPVADWASLADFPALLPGPERLALMAAQRRSRLDLKLGRPGVGTPPRLAALVGQQAGVLRQLGNGPAGPAASSLADRQRAAARQLSLEDLLSGPPHRLRGRAEVLRNRLDQATACLVQRLPDLPPAVRLAWAQAAEKDRLPVESPLAWPAMDRIQAEDLGGLRTLVELVTWLFRQLAAGASGPARTALRNLVRAVLLLAAGDDPFDLVHGTVQTLPGRFQTGAVLRLTLNRPARPGSELQLFDPDQRLVGLVRVEDQDGQGTLAQVIQVFRPDSPLAADCTVAGRASQAIR